VHAHFLGGFVLKPWEAPRFDFLALRVPYLTVGLLIRKQKGDGKALGHFKEIRGYCLPATVSRPGAVQKADDSRRRHTPRCKNLFALTIVRLYN
jgi:hypothetical protein